MLYECGQHELLHITTMQNYVHDSRSVYKYSCIVHVSQTGPHDTEKKLFRKYSCKVLMSVVQDNTEKTNLSVNIHAKLMSGQQDHTEKTNCLVKKSVEPFTTSMLSIKHHSTSQQISFDSKSPEIV